MPVHGHALYRGAKSVLDKMPVRLRARHGDGGQKLRPPDRDSQRFAGVEQPTIILFGRWSFADRAEFNKAKVGAGLAAWPVVTHRERSNAAGTFKQDCIAD